MTRAGGIALAGKALEFGTLVPLVTVVPRALGPGSYGLFALGTSVVALGASAAALGGPTLASRFIAGAPTGRRVGIARAIVRRSALPRVAAAAVVAIVAAAWTFPDNISPAATGLVVLALVLDVLATLLLQAGLPLGGFVAWSVRYPAQNVVLVAAVLALEGSGTTAMLAALPIASAAGLVLALATASPHLRGAATAASLPSGLRRFALIQGAAGLVQLLLYRGPVFAVALAGAAHAEVGYIGIAVSIASAAIYAVWQVYVMELPELVQSRQEDAARAVQELTRVFLLFLIPATVIGVLLAETVVPRLLGADFEKAVTPVAVALGILPLAPAAGALNQATALRLTPERRLVAAVIGAVVFAAVAAGAAPAWDATGAAVALVAGMAVYVIAGCVACPDLVRVRATTVAVAAAAAVVGIALTVDAAA